MSGRADLSHSARLWLDNVELVRANRQLTRRLRQLERTRAAEPVSGS